MSESPKVRVEALIGSVALGVTIGIIVGLTWVAAGLNILGATAEPHDLRAPCVERGGVRQIVASVWVERVTVVVCEDGTVHDVKVDG